MKQLLEIDLWYGDDQPFGENGVPQRWVNVLGRVKGPSPIRKLVYTLNDGELVALSWGPDRRRLSARGDFNIDVDIRQLEFGPNRIQVRAEDVEGNAVSASTTVRYTPQPCPLPYAIHWSEVRRIHDVAHVVDGIWSITDNGISPEEISYDRLIAIGDMSWQDYEVTVPITVHAINATCYNDHSVHAGVGIVLRWKGHSNWGSDQWSSGQPYYGPGPYGAITWYCVFHDAGPILNFFDPDFQLPAELPRKLNLHVPYVFKSRVETLADGSSQYSLKVWPQEEQEPDTWDITAPGSVTALKEGAILLVAHHTAATFGDVTIRALG